MNIKLGEISLKSSKSNLERKLIDVVDIISENSKYLPTEYNIEERVSLLNEYIKKNYSISLKNDSRIDSRYLRYDRSYGFSRGKYFIAYYVEDDYEPDDYKMVYYKRLNSVYYVTLFKELK